jgi:hypothetical protein
LCQVMFGSSLHGEGRVADSYNLFLLHEGLTPHGDERVIDGGRGSVVVMKTT